MCCRLFRSIPGLYPPPQEASNAHSSPTKNVFQSCQLSSKVARCPLGEGKGIKLALVENH